MIRTNACNKQKRLIENDKRFDPIPLNLLLLNPTASVATRLVAKSIFRRQPDKPAEKSRHQAEIWKTRNFPPSRLI